LLIKRWTKSECLQYLLSYFFLFINKKAFDLVLRILIFLAAEEGGTDGYDANEQSCFILEISTLKPKLKYGMDEYFELKYLFPEGS